MHNTIHRSIKSGLKLILNVSNGLAKIRAATTKQVESGASDPLTLAETFGMEVKFHDAVHKLQVSERGFESSELRLLMEVTGYDVQAVYGGSAGSWHRQTVSLD
jgi:hypothetical protein